MGDDLTARADQIHADWERQVSETIRAWRDARRHFNGDNARAVAELAMQITEQLNALKISPEGVITMLAITLNRLAQGEA